MDARSRWTPFPRNWTAISDRTTPKKFLWAKTAGRGISQLPCCRRFAASVVSSLTSLSSERKSDRVLPSCPDSGSCLHPIRVWMPESHEDTDPAYSDARKCRVAAATGSDSGPLPQQCRGAGSWISAARISGRTLRSSAGQGPLLFRVSAESVQHSTDDPARRTRGIRTDSVSGCCSIGTGVSLR